MRKALILTGLPLTAIGGIEKIGQNIRDLLLDHQWEVDAKSSHDLIPNALHKANYPLFQYFEPAVQFGWKAYDLVITNNFVGGAIYQTEHTKVITLVHGLFTAAVKQMEAEIPDVVGNFKTEFMLEELAYQNKTKLISISLQVKEELHHHIGETSRLIYNGFDFTFFGKNQDNFRNELNIPPAAIVGLYAGRWSLLEKRPDIILEVSKSFPEIIWIFATDSDIPALEAQNNIRVMKNVPHNQMPKLYNTANFSIQLSSYEGSSNFAMESFASKIPMVSTKVGILREIYVDTKLEDLLIDQSYDRAIVKERAIEKVELLVENITYYNQALLDLYPSVKENFSLERWRKSMLQELDPDANYQPKKYALDNAKSITRLIDEYIIDDLLHSNEAERQIKEFDVIWDKKNIRDAVVHLVENASDTNKMKIISMLQTLEEQISQKDFFYKNLSQELVANIK
jgi:glycosyltransferase involved in cell wall biosynthesis